MCHNILANGVRLANAKLRPYKNFWDIFCSLQLASDATGTN